VQVLVFYSTFTGLTASTYWATIAPILAEVVDLKDLNTALSMSFFSLVLPLTFAEAIALEITKNTGSYLGTQLFTGLAYIAGAIFLWFIKAWKVGDIEMEDDLSQYSRKSTATEKDTIRDEEARSSKRSSMTKRLITWKRV
jgi:predicted MFS family arabinose efflux permease